MLKKIGVYLLIQILSFRYTGELSLEQENLKCFLQLYFIRNYCETDVLNTYLVYLRLIYLKNQLTDEEYDAEILKVKSKLSSSSLLHWNEFLTAWEKYEQ